MNAKRPIMIMAGGTGGHIFPALAVASVLRHRGEDLVWLGTRRGLEAKLVPAEGIKMEWIEIVGLRGKGWRDRLFAPFRLGLALLQSLRILRLTRPKVVLGFGGYVSGPCGLMAAVTRIPLVLHEQNAVPGLTNRLLARFASRVFTGFPVALPGSDANREFSGNPIRPEIASLPEPSVRMKERQGPLRVLVLGGSQGAMSLNRIVPAALARLPAALRPEVWHQAGERHMVAAESAYEKAEVAARVVPFVSDMAKAYGWADLVICRSGALTVAELAAAGVASLLVPFPHAVDDHQYFNGNYLVTAGAARMLLESELTDVLLARELTDLLDRPRLMAMAVKARNLAHLDAAERIAMACMQLGNDGRVA